MTETKTELIEKLAELEHEQWSHWMKYLETKRYRQFEPQPAFHEDDWVYWMKQTQIPYEKLSDQEKDSDREWARKAYGILEADVLRERMELVGKFQELLKKKPKHLVGKKGWADDAGYWENDVEKWFELFEKVLAVLGNDKPRCHFDNIHVYKKETNK